MRRREFLTGVAASLAMGQVAVAGSPKKVCLLSVGNSSYAAVKPLNNPTRDAQLVADTFRKLVPLISTVEAGLIIDGTRQDILERAEWVRQRGGTCVMYYAGHGVQIGEDNYLIPVDMDPVWSEADFKKHAVTVFDIVEAYAGHPEQSFVLLLDACRTNPLTFDWASSSKGLAAPRALPNRVAISYSCQPGRTTLDGTPGSDSYYAIALSQILARNPTVSLGELFRGLQEQVSAATRGEQVPWFTSTISPDHRVIAPT
jgi:uncharacterized caspase-like protein